MLKIKLYKFIKEKSYIFHTERELLNIKFLKKKALINEKV